LHSLASSPVPQWLQKVIERIFMLLCQKVVLKASSGKDGILNAPMQITVRGTCAVQEDAPFRPTSSAQCGIEPRRKIVVRTRLNEKEKRLIHQRVATGCRPRSKFGTIVASVDRLAPVYASLTAM
jgi:hypothetical protein